MGAVALCFWSAVPSLANNRAALGFVKLPPLAPGSPEISDQRWRAPTRLGNPSFRRLRCFDGV
jgi:hypothetical protein